jgi:hypothetical protein
LGRRQNHRQCPFQNWESSRATEGEREDQVCCSRVVSYDEKGTPAMHSNGLSPSVVVSLSSATADPPSSMPASYDSVHHMHSAWTSNLLFLVGSCLYVWLALWDIHSEKSWYLAVEESQAASRWTTWMNPYMIVSVAAASCYVIDATRLVCHRSQGLSHPVGLEQAGTNVHHQSHNHFLHRFQSSKAVAVSVGLTFGLGAVFDLVAALTSELPDPRISDWAVVGASHSYFVNAVLLLSGKSVVFTTPSQKAAVLGDFLFLVGSLIEVSLSYFYIGQESDLVWKYVYIGYLFSSILWLLNALLYIAADIMKDHHRYETACIIERAEGVAVTFMSPNPSELHKDRLLEDYSLALVEEHSVDATSREIPASSLDQYAIF